MHKQWSFLSSFISRHSIIHSLQYLDPHSTIFTVVHSVTHFNDMLVVTYNTMYCSVLVFHSIAAYHIFSTRFFSTRRCCSGTISSFKTSLYNNVIISCIISIYYSSCLSCTDQFSCCRLRVHCVYWSILMLQITCSLRVLINSHVADYVFTAMSGVLDYTFKFEHANLNSTQSKAMIASMTKEVQLFSCFT